MKYFGITDDKVKEGSILKKIRITLKPVDSALLK